MGNKKSLKKTVSIAIILAFLSSPLSLLKAEDYPAGYAGPGHREYLSGKIQGGYYVETFVNRDIRQNERVVKRNEIEKIVSASYEAAAQAANGLSAVEFQKKYNTDDLKAEIAKQRQQREQAASAQAPGGFTYIPHSDGKIEYFKDGLVIRVENERTLDQFGNLAIKNTSNIKYNDRRLMTGYDATVRDHLGNVTQVSWYGAAYTADSLYYAGADTQANKSLSEYSLKETDSAGNVKVTHWQAQGYQGKTVRAFHQKIEDSVYGTIESTRSNITYNGNNPEQVSSYREEGVGADGLAYTLERTGITYTGKNQVLGYREEMLTTQESGAKIKTVTEAQFKYSAVNTRFGADVEEADPDNLLESVMTVTTESPDGSSKTETTTTKYEYGANGLARAAGQSAFYGEEAKWSAGANAGLKNGNKYSGDTAVSYETGFGRPMLKKAETTVNYYDSTGVNLLREEKTSLDYSNGLVNNLPRPLETKELTGSTYYPLIDPNGVRQTGTKNVTTAYNYAPNGNLSGASGKGSGSGYELTNNSGWMRYTSDIDINHEVILGEARQKKSQEDKNYKP